MLGFVFSLSDSYGKGDEARLTGANMFSSSRQGSWATANKRSYNAAFNWMSDNYKRSAFPKFTLLL